MSTYLFSLLAKPGHRQLVGDFVLFTGNDKDFLSTRVSYKLNLRGPSIAVQTACSTSLVAVAMACDSLFTHQCDMALAGGVAIRVPQKSGYMFQEGRIFFTRRAHSVLRCGSEWDTFFKRRWPGRVEAGGRRESGTAIAFVRSFVEAHITTMAE